MIVLMPTKSINILFSSQYLNYLKFVNMVILRCICFQTWFLSFLIVIFNFNLQTLYTTNNPKIKNPKIAAIPKKVACTTAFTTHPSLHPHIPPNNLSITIDTFPPAASSSCRFFSLSTKPIPRSCSSSGLYFASNDAASGAKPAAGRADGKLGANGKFAAGACWAAEGAWGAAEEGAEEANICMTLCMSSGFSAMRRIWSFMRGLLGSWNMLLFWRTF